MAEALWLCTKNLGNGVGGQRVIDGVVAVLINADDAQTAAETISEAVAQCQAAGHALYSNYFSAAAMVGVAVTNTVDTDLDCYVFTNYNVTLVEAPA